ncbi:hypothetical protein CBR_g20169 [Chara braunii]|uniref:J domain-containing protein n=1 Tax=Chara braunii TaxID=69332 RepID=A0A388KZU7_CHABU|nr:hypothetical protein CBR_g20169 [Chara braunii]|eukprot:GBG75538.1 hypothetical protein CBR_g20169 [Chara braunii]
MRIGVAAYEAGDVEKAIRFLAKAQKLYPSREVADILLRIAKGEKNGVNGYERDDEQSRSQNSESAEPSSKYDGGQPGRPGAASASADTEPSPSSSNVRRRTVSSAGAAEGGSSNGSAGPATPEQIEAVRSICGSSNYYEMLGLEKEATDEDVKKAYRKLALKLHPDKNKAPGAEEAFKKVSKAFQCLSDADLRANYDRYGHEEGIQAIQRQRAASAARTELYDDFDPNEIFNAFFFGTGYPNLRVYRTFSNRHPQRVYTQHANYANHQEPAGGFSVIGLIQLLPVAMFLLLTIFSGSDPVFRLERKDPYLYERRTTKLDVPFYIKKNTFEQDYPLHSRQRKRLEDQVESQYRENVETRCFYEQVQQQQLYRSGHASKARSMKMAACDEYRRIQSVY